MPVSDGPVKLFGRLACVFLLYSAHAGAVSPMDSPLHSSSFLTSDGVRLHVLEACPRGVKPADQASPVIAFVPGWSMPATVWEDQLLALGETHCVAALDPRGQGESEVAAAGYTIDRRADDLHEFITRYPRVVLVGWSLGALEALHCIHRHGHEGIAGLVLVDSSVGEEPAPPSGSGFLEALRADRRAAVADFMQGIFGDSRDVAEIAGWTETALRMPLEASLSLFPGTTWPRTHWRDIARSFPKPLLYAVSPQFAAQARSLQQHRPATGIAVFEEAGHALFIDDPAGFSALIGEFVTEAAR